MKPIQNSDGGSEAVDRFFAELEHELKPAMEAIRTSILSAEKGVTEHIKWNAPSFCHGGDDRITFNLHRKGYLLLIFHRGAKPKPLKTQGHLINDPSGKLEWLADDRASLKITSENDFAEISPQLKTLVRKWLAAAAGNDG